MADPADEHLALRKTEHLRLATTAQAQAHDASLLECVLLRHHSLPEATAEQIDTSTTYCGKALRLPLVITGMSGGIAEAAALNRDLAAIAQEFGVAFGVGSQRPMQRDPNLADSYRVRDVAPEVCLLGNLGGVQAAALSTSEVAALVEQIGADALAIHLNPAQELAQPEGDRDFRGVAEGLGRLRRELPCPVVVKETGCGLSTPTLQLLTTLGIVHVDVSGVGGTSWPAIEGLRQAQPSNATIGYLLRAWGLPTAVTTRLACEHGFHVTSSGGIRNGLDAARALALGAQLVGMAAPLLAAWQRQGRDGVRRALTQFADELRTVMLLSGCRNLQALRRSSPSLLEPLASLLAAHRAVPDVVP